MPEANFQYRSSAKPIPYEELDLPQQWESFDIGHELTIRGLEKFVADYRKSLADTAVASWSTNPAAASIPICTAN